TSILMVAVLFAAACSPPPAAKPAAPAGEPTKPAAPVAPAAAPAASPAAAAPAACKVAQLYTSPTTDKGWSWAHEQSFLAVKKDLPYVDLSVRKDSVPDDNKQLVIDVL